MESVSGEIKRIQCVYDDSARTMETIQEIC